MNLQENIQRIQGMMGIVTESLNDKFSKMVDSMGFLTAIKFVGGYDEMIKLFGEESITRDIKIKLIREAVLYHKNQTGDSGIPFFNYHEQPIFYYEDRQVIKQIEHLDLDSVVVDSYQKPDDTYIDSEQIPYEELNDEVINDIFMFALDVLYNEYN